MVCLWWVYEVDSDVCFDMEEVGRACFEEDVNLSLAWT